MRRPLSAALAASLVLVVTACGDDSAGDEEPSALEGVTVSGEFGEQPTVKTDESFAAEDATSAEIVAGDGEELAADSVVQAKIAVYDSDGKFVDGNYEGDAVRVDLAQEQVPWLAELVGANVGSRVAVALPVTDVVGPQGDPAKGLDPEEPMIFLVDVLEVAQAPLEGPEGTAVDPPADAPTVLGDEPEVTGLDFSDVPEAAPKEFRAITLIEGDGAKVEQGQQVTVNYFGTVWGKGDAPFDSSYERGEPATFPLTEGGLIDGWVKGLTGVPVGSRVMLIIPPELGYGAQGSGTDIPGGATLVFVIDVLAAG